VHGGEYSAVFGEAKLAKFEKIVKTVKLN